jgi:hypothetical protein
MVTLFTSACYSVSGIAIIVAMVVLRRMELSFFRK